MCPITHTSLLALGTAVVVSFIFGFLWYGPIFGKAWAGLMGFKIEDGKGKKPPVSSLILTIFGTCLTTFVLAYILHNSKLQCNFGVGLLAWIGFYIPLLLGTVTWEGRPWKLFALNAAYNFLNLQLIAAIVTYL